MDILEMLAKVGLELPEDRKGEFDKEFRKSYKSVSELNKVKEDLKAKETEVAELTEKLEEKTKTTGTFEEKKKEYEDKITNLTKELSDIKFNNVLSKALTGIEFSSDRVKDSVLVDIRAKEFKEDKEGKLEGLDDFLKELYEKEPGTFKSVDSEIYTWGGSGTEEEVKNKPSVFNRIL